jgi:hypothetical protein
MSDKNDSYSAKQLPFNTIQRPDYDESFSEDPWKDGREWHLEFGYTPDLPCPFPIVPAGTCDKHDAVGILQTTAGFTFSTPESSRNLCVLACGHVCRSWFSFELHAG